MTPQVVSASLAVTTAKVPQYLVYITAHRLERPIIANVSLSYRPTIHRFSPMTQRAGVEYLTIAFPPTKYPGHLAVRGFIDSIDSA